MRCIMTACLRRWLRHGKRHVRHRQEQRHAYRYGTYVDGALLCRPRAPSPKHPSPPLSCLCCDQSLIFQSFIRSTSSRQHQTLAMPTPSSTNQQHYHHHHHEEEDLWTKFIEGTVHLVEKLCPPLEHSLQWDFSDCGPLLSIEDECCTLESDAGSALSLKVTGAVPNAA